MADGMVIQGRQWSESDLDGIRNLMVAHPDWGRTRISVELCRQWDWHNQQGCLKDMAARTLLLKLERTGHLRWPCKTQAQELASAQRPAHGRPARPCRSHFAHGGKTGSYSAPPGGAVRRLRDGEP